MKEVLAIRGEHGKSEVCNPNFEFFLLRDLVNQDVWELNVSMNYLFALKIVKDEK